MYSVRACCLAQDPRRLAERTASKDLRMQTGAKTDERTQETNAPRIRNRVPRSVADLSPICPSTACQRFHTRPSIRSRIGTPHDQGTGFVRSQANHAPMPRPRWFVARRVKSINGKRGPPYPAESEPRTIEGHTGASTGCLRGGDSGMTQRHAHVPAPQHEQGTRRDEKRDWHTFEGGQNNERQDICFQSYSTPMQ